MKSHKHTGGRKARLRRNADGGPNLLLWGGALVGGYFVYRWWMGKDSKSAPARVPAMPATAPKAAAPIAPPSVLSPPVAPQMPLPAAPAAPADDTSWRSSMSVEEMDAAAKAADPSKSMSGIGNYYNEP